MGIRRGRRSPASPPRQTCRPARARVPAALALLAFATIAAAHDQVPGQPQSRPVLLRGGDLYTVANGVLPATDLLFVDGRIRAIGATLEAPEGAQVIDVSGHRVYPGLIAPQTQLGLIEIGAVRATNDRAEVGEVTPEAAAHVAYNPDSELIPTVRSHGITTVQVVPAGSLIRGLGFITHLDGWTKEDAGLRLVDGLQVAWPSDTPRRLREAERSKSRERTEEQRRAIRRAFAAARAYDAERRADAEREIDVRWEAMREAVRGEQPVYVLAQDYRQIVEAVDFAAEAGIRMVLVGGRDAHRLTDLLVERDIPVIVGRVAETPQRPGDDYDLPYRLPALLHEAGVRFCIGHASWGPWDVRNLPFYAGLAAGVGLPQDAALRAITLSTAEILGVEDEIGSLEVGKQATLFVSGGDVMDMLGQRVTLMYIEGREVDLDDRHKELYRKYRRKSERP